MEGNMESRFLEQCEAFLVEKFGKEQGKIISNRAYERFQEICMENSGDTKEMLIHTRDRIYPGIAVFDSLLEYGSSREEAQEFVVEYYSWRSNIMGKKINKFMKLPGLYRFAPKICRKLTGKMFSEQAGFKAKQYEKSKSEVRFDMIECPYWNKCKEYGCPEITHAYCKADEICFGNMHEKIIFSRSKTLANHDECCNFSFKNS